ncbi:N-terminal region of Chorein, a TM vesicle-mediated sorter-domain-containing protein, partial [Blyttiomyces helicus]
MPEGKERAPRMWDTLEGSLPPRLSNWVTFSTRFTVGERPALSRARRVPRQPLLKCVHMEPMLMLVPPSLPAQFLGDYVDNLESKQLSIGLWQGDVVLHNLRLKKDALDKFDLPIDVLEGYLGDLTLSIPWSDLKNKPVKVKMNNVYLLAVPKADVDYDPDFEEERELRIKKERLDILGMKGKAADPESDKQDSTFTAQLVTKVVDNLQISMTNIHIRYEDKISSPKTPFSVGFTLAELSAVSTDENWKEAYIHLSTGRIHKLLSLDSLAVYWNTNSVSLAGKSPAESIRVFSSLIASGKRVPPEHQYILKPVSGSGK